MSARQLVGWLIIGSILGLLVVATAIAVGTLNALLVWGAAIVIAVALVVGVHLTV